MNCVAVFAIALARKGRWVSKIKHPRVCAVISMDSFVTVRRASALMDMPMFAPIDPDFPNGPRAA